MNRIKKLFALSFAVFAFSFVGFSGESFAASEVKPARTVEQEIYKKLLRLPNYNVFDHITYQVNGDTVVLSGKTITLGTKRAAAEVVKDVPGIKNVVNNIEELPVGSFDNRIRYSVLRSFVDRGPAQYFNSINPDVRIIVKNGRITLEGFVARESDANLMNLLANGIPGVFEVTNNLVVGRDSRRS